MTHEASYEPTTATHNLAPPSEPTLRRLARTAVYVHVDPVGARTLRPIEDDPVTRALSGYPPEFD